MKYGQFSIFLLAIIMICALAVSGCITINLEVPTTMVTPTPTPPTSTPINVLSSWTSALDGWSVSEYSPDGPTPGVGIVSSDGNQLSLRADKGNDYVTIFRYAGMTAHDTLRVSVYNDVRGDEEWHLGGIFIGCNANGEGILTQWWGSSFAPVVGPWSHTGIQSKYWSVPQRTAGMWVLPHGQWYDIKIVCDGSSVTTYYKLSSGNTWTLVSSSPIGDNWKGGYVGMSGNYHGTIYKDFQLYKS